MTKEEVVEKCNALYSKIEEIETTVSDLLYAIKQLSRDAEELPDDPKQIEDSEADETRG